MQHRSEQDMWAEVKTCLDHALLTLTELRIAHHKDVQRSFDAFQEAYRVFRRDYEES